ncbi:aminopeptidase P family protein [Alphaproteobacteria bacterium KMM 3653]|uniref:Aminopeptidase P family protein n=1 Tax=Harenicola maris TaxID=2841044 RepID=A0AAP2CKS4_9RHOB|nr:aminopeptidase P family protein [Harenicola maris]
MYQSFDAPTRPQDGPPRLHALREWMATRSIHAFIVPRADVHQGEYVAPRDDCLAWLTGFTGSAGFAAVTSDKAGVFIDGRYRVQVKAQIADCYAPVPWPETKLADWLKEALPGGGTVAMNAWLHTRDELTKLEKALKGSGITLAPGTDDPFDAIWPDRPAAPQGAAEVFPEGTAGKTHAEKRTEIAKSIAAKGADSAVITLPDSIAWLLNIRGADIPRNPVKQGFAILSADGHCALYADLPEPEALQGHLGNHVTIHPKEAFAQAIPALTGRVLVDPKTAPAQVFTALTAQAIHADDPCILPKAVKTEAELAATRGTHLRDAAAVIRHLKWISEEAPKGSLTEIDVVKHLEACRAEDPALRDISFDTIAGTGAHGAVVHYRVTTETNAPVTPGDLLLIDSGGQYQDGTTDITRTLPTGPVTDEQKACFTRVLRGMIDMSMMRWPKGLAGRDIDAVARIPLWQAGMDYDHGTGHGVGVFLSVHEGPQRLSRLGHVPLQSGMILSNEPGYYREGEFGIRIENLVTVRPAPNLPGADNRAMLCFDTLTWVPIDRGLIDVASLNPAQIDWLNAYHAQTYEKVSPFLDEQTAQWLEQACAPL